MKIVRATIDKLDTSSIASWVCSGAIQRFPPLAPYHCLAHAPKQLASQTVAAFSAGRSIHQELISMPRRRLGIRPVNLLAPQDRVLYEALCNRVLQDVPDNRSYTAWSEFYDFAHPTNDADTLPNYLVEIDIASCYEYINHKILSEELYLQLDSRPEIDPIVSMLDEICGSNLGLPQLSEGSDRLAEIYLARIERDLLRAGYSVVRWADDFKVGASSWSEALTIIDEAAESARRSGLVLSTEKTIITKMSTLKRRIEREFDILGDYFADVATGDGRGTRTRSPYGDDPADEDIPEEEEDEEKENEESPFDRVMDWKLVNDWCSKKHLRNVLSQYLSVSLMRLAGADERIEDDCLLEIVFQNPLLLEAVSNYIKRRSHEVNQSWDTLQGLTAIARQSSWSRIWMLHVAGRLQSSESRSEESVRSWVQDQVASPYEIVRAQSSWTLAGLQGITSEELGRLYSTASDLTRPSLAASAGRSGISTGPIVKAMCGDSKLSKAAYDWGVWRIDNE